MSQRLELSQRQEMIPMQRLSLDQRLTQQMEVLENAFPSEGKKEEMFKNLINSALENIKNENLRKGLANLIAGDAFSNLVFKYIDNIFSNSSEGINDLAIEYIYNMHRGSFEIKGAGEINYVINDVTLGVFRDAYQKPDAFIDEIEKEEEILEKMTQKDNLRAQIKTYRNTLTVVESIREELSLVTDLFKLLFNQKFNDQNENILDFINETSLLSKFRLFESERLTKRFVNNCDDVGLSHSPERHEDFLLNTVGEFVLISLGIISPNVFILKQGNIDEEMEASLRQFTEEANLDFDKIMKRYSLTKRGGFFYQRWATLNEKPSFVNDEKVRAFITKTVRKNREELLKSANFVELIEDIKQIKRDTDDKVERKERFYTLFDDLFKDEDFIKVLLDHIKEWYAELRVFYPNTKKE